MPLLNLQRIVLLGSILFLLFSALAQTTSISGTVTDEISGKPVPFSSVYFNNTTIGTSADSAGRYRINNIPVEFKELVVSSIGYSSARTILKLKHNESLVVNIKLAPKKSVLQNVIIQDKKKRADKNWKKNYDLFKEYFLGTSFNAQLSEIVNPEVLEFKTELSSNRVLGSSLSENNTLIAIADEPIKIINRSLGYMLHIALEHFEASRLNSTILFTARFDTLIYANEKDKARWAQNRMMTYKGSLRHLFKSIHDGRYEEEGFLIYHGPYAVPTKQFSIASMNHAALKEDVYGDTLPYSSKILRKGTYQIHYLVKELDRNNRTFTNYPYPVSWINVEDSLLTVKSNGEPVLPANYLLYGYFNSLRISDLLPQDFNPIQEESKFLLLKRIEQVSINGVVLDRNYKPLQGVEVFINNGLTCTTTNAWGQFEIPNLFPGKYPIGFYFNGLKEKLITAKAADNEGALTVQLDELKETVQLQQRDTIWQLLKTDFEHKLLQLAPISFSQSKIINPEVLNFWKYGDNIGIKAAEPLVIDNAMTGYQWKYYMDSAVFIGRKHKLFANGLVKMTELPNSSSRQRINRYDEYVGSWSHFIHSLIDGRTEEEGFKVYRLLTAPSKRLLKLKKIEGKYLVSLNPDSLLIPDDTRLRLSIPKGLEIHYLFKKGEKKLYKGYSNQVMRIRSNSSSVLISKSGINNSRELEIEGVKKQNLSRIPVEFRPNKEKATNPDVMTFVKNENLKSIRNLQEKVYLQTDKDYYYPNDTLWFKAYIKYAQPSLSDSLSKLLYVELVSPENYVTTGRILKIKNGEAWGEIGLPYNLKPGDYYLRAFTSWMKNFDEYFTSSVPILAADDFIKTSLLDSTSVVPDGINIYLATGQKEYKTKESIDLSINFSNHTGPIEASFSISVTDQSATTDINPMTIQSLDKPFKADGLKMIRLKYPIERKMVLNGHIIDGYEKETYTLSAWSVKDQLPIVKEMKGGQFQLDFDFTDTTSLLIKCIDRFGHFVHSDLDQRDSIHFFIPPAPIPYVSINKNYQKTPLTSSQHSRLLNEVLIKGKRIVPDSYKGDLPINKRYGMIYKIIDKANMLSIQQKNNLTFSLNELLPDFHATSQLIYQKNTRFEAVPDDLAKESEQQQFDAFRNRIYSFTLDGLPTNYTVVNSIRASDITRIEIFHFPHIIALYTTLTVPFKIAEFDIFKIQGVHCPSKFIMQPLISKTLNYKATVYWNPQIQTNQSGNASVHFNSTDVPGDYKVTIEGKTSENQFFHIVKMIDVNQN